VAGRERKRGECQTRLGLVWRETGAVRNGRRSRGQAASTQKGRKWGERRRSLPLKNDGWLLGMGGQHTAGAYKN
jgi:hypothetical protein